MTAKATPAEAMAWTKADSRVAGNKKEPTGLSGRTIYSHFPAPDPIPTPVDPIRKGVVFFRRNGKLNPVPAPAPPPRLA